MLKRIGFFISIILIILLVLGIGWFIRWRNTIPESPSSSSGGSILPTSPLQPSPSQGASSSTSSSTVSVPSLKEKPFGMIADQEVLAYYAYPDGSVIFIQPTGQVIKIYQGEGIILSSLSIKELHFAQFSFDGKFISAAFGNPDNQELSVFDVEKKSWTPIFARPSSEPLWAPNDYRLIFFTTDRDNSFRITLVDTKEKTPKAQEVMTLRGQDLLLDWKSDTELLILEKGSAYGEAQAFTLRLSDKKVAPFLKDWAGLNLLWDSRIQQGVAFRANKNRSGGSMSLLGSSGIISQQFSFITLPREKCGFIGASSSLNLFCAIPKNGTGFETSVLPDSYFQKETTTDDSLVHINLETGKVTDISQNISEPIDAFMLQSVLNTTYFINRYNHKLYRLIQPE